MKDPIYLKAFGYLEAADDQMKQMNNSSALELLELGIAEVGQRYVARDTVDDTPMKLTLANAKKKSGEWELCLNLKKSVLRSRLEMYKKNNCP
jgi:hypothetical protein